MDNDRDNDREELIRRRAYAIWEQEGRPDGQQERHWEQAAREMQGDGSSQGDGEQRVEPETPAGGSPPSKPAEGSPTKAARSSAAR